MDTRKTLENCSESEIFTNRGDSMYISITPINFGDQKISDL